ncbi:MAG: heavy-metal-associated domain-containing protein [Planctomycetes bacterium]|nr:heavy-metal-associated domain-containing protein [Planctomycetota bacterium]
MSLRRSLTTSILLAALLPAACDRSDPLAARTTTAAPVVIRLQVDGMHCQGCVDAITDKVTRVEGVVDCRVSLEQRQADVAVRESTTAPEVRKAIERLGYKVTPLQ